AEASLVRDAIDEEVLYREAFAARIGERDPVTRERLVRLGDFLGEDGARGREALEREARGLGLERSDVVIRRHLVEMMRLAAAKPAPADVPSEAELQAWLDAHASEFTQPPTLRLTHVYLSAETRGATAAADAQRLLDELRRTGAGPDAAAAPTDPFIRGTPLGPTTAGGPDRGARADRGVARHRGGRVRVDHGAERLGEEHAPPPDGRPRRADGGRDRHRGDAHLAHERRRDHHLPAAEDRLRVPVLQPPADLFGRGERGAPAAPRPPPPARRARPRPGGARPGRA